MALTFPPSALDGNQVLQHAFDEATCSLRVTGGSGGGGGPISHVTDSIRLGDGTTLTTVTTDNGKSGLDVNVINDLALDIDHTADSIRIGDGVSLATTTTVGPSVGLDVNVLNDLNFSEDVNKCLTDVASSTVTYVGEAQTTAASEAAAVWRITRITLDTLTGNSETLVASDGAFDQIWNNRVSIF